MWEKELVTWWLVAALGAFYSLIELGATWRQEASTTELIVYCTFVGIAFLAFALRVMWGKNLESRETTLLVCRAQMDELREQMEGRIEVLRLERDRLLKGKGKKGETV